MPLDLGQPTLAACHREGPAEKAGRSLEKAGDNVRDAVNGKKQGAQPAVDLRQAARGLTRHSSSRAVPG